jgi:glycosyltransferase involved in cell wall biosynthesis
MPLALLEAMASGCVPVILGRISSGVPEIINDGGNGLLCSGEVEHVVSRLEHFSPKEMDAMGSEAWRTIRDGHFSMTRMLESYEALFQKVTASQRIKT